MTNAELLAKLRAEIDKLYGEYKDKFHQCGDLYHLGLIDGLDMAERVLDTLESEKPMSQEGLEEELDKWRHNHFHGKRDDHFSGEYLERTSQLDLARHFAKWGAEHLASADKTSPKELEEPVCEELDNEIIRIEFKKIEQQCFEEGIVGWQKEKLIARHFYDLGLNARKEG